MFDIGWTELIVVAVVMILVVGPKDLPGMLRNFGKAIRGMRRMAGDFQRQFDDALREAELDEVKNLTPTNAFTPLDDAKKSINDVKKQVSDTLNEPVDAETSAPKPASATPAKQPRTATSKSTKPASTKKTTTAAKKSAPASKPAAGRTAAKKAAPTSKSASKPTSAAKTAKPKSATKRATTKAKTGTDA